MKIAVVSIEFSIGTFSGNGIYAIAQVRALRSLGHDVLVVCGCPPGVSPPSPPPPPGSPGVLAVPLPVWGRLDLGSGWREFALGCGAFKTAQLVGAFGAEAVVGVDWHSAAAYEALEGALTSQGFPVPPYFCSNYRVYLRSAPEAEREAMRRLEGASFRRAVAATVLSRSDLDFVRHHYSDEIQRSPVTVLLPALRSDVAAVPPPAGPRPRRYLTCCVRASPEKEPRRFVDLVCELQRRGVFDSGEVAPLVAGAGWAAGRQQEDTEDEALDPGVLGSVERYACELRRRLEAEVPAAVIADGFLDATGMAALFADTVLNIHPPAYDAYGMTIVEAASQGAPSLVAHEGHVGATDLLDPGKGQIFVTDVEAGAAALADVVQGLLADREGLEATGAAAAGTARAWSEEANAAALIDVLRIGIDQHGDLLSDTSHSIPKSRGGVDVVPANALSVAAFEATYLEANRPVILTEATVEWPAAQEWVTFDGDVDLDALEARFSGAGVSAVDAAPRHRGAGPRREWTFAEYAAWWRTQKETKESSNGRSGGTVDLQEMPLWYLKDWHCVAACAARGDGFQPYQCPELFRDDWLNEYYDSLQANEGSGVTGSGDGTIVCSDYRFVYLGPAGTATPLHADVVRSHSWSANLAGRKRWRLLPPAAAPLIHDAAGTAHPHSFHADEDHLECEGSNPASKSTKTRFPHLPRAREAVLEIVQYPGEAIFVPSGWFHTVENLDECLSINHNWVSSNSLAAAVAYLGRERARAAALIEDCVEICGAAEFEGLVQRNVGANAGLDYAGMGAMVRRAAGGAAAFILRRQNDEEEGLDGLPDPPAWLDFEHAVARLRAAAPVLRELAGTLRAALAAPGGRGAGGEEDAAAREVWTAEIAADEGCLDLVNRALAAAERHGVD